MDLMVPVAINVCKRRNRGISFFFPSFLFLSCLFQKSIKRTKTKERKTRRAQAHGIYQSVYFLPGSIFRYVQRRNGNRNISGKNGRRYFTERPLSSIFSTTLFFIPNFHRRVTWVSVLSTIFLGERRRGLIRQGQQTMAGSIFALFLFVDERETRSRLEKSVLLGPLDGKWDGLTWTCDGG